MSNPRLTAPLAASAHRPVPWLVAAIAGLLILTSCSSIDPSIERAESVISTLPESSASSADVDTDGATDSGPVTAEATLVNCETQTVLDEYGFPVEVEICEGQQLDDVLPGASAAAPTATPTPAMDSPELAYQLLRDHLIVQRSCLNPELVDADRPVAAGTTIPGLADVLNRALDVSARIRAACQTDEALWKAATRDGVDVAIEAAQLLGAEEGVTYEESARYVRIDTRDPQFFAPDALEVMIDALGPVYVAQKGLPGNARDEFWFTTTHRNNTELLVGLRQRNQDTRAVLLTGTSVMKSAVNEQELAAATNVPAANLGIAGAHGLGLLDYLESDVIPLSQPAVVVVEVTYLFSHLSCTNARAELFASSVDLRAEVLAGNTFYTDATSGDLLIQASDVNQELDKVKGAFNSNWYYPRRNFTEEKTATTDELVEYGTRLEDREVERCPFVDGLAPTLAAIEQAGSDAVLVFLPIPPSVRAADERWAAEFAEFSGFLAETASATDAQVLDLSGVLADEQFRDFAHMNDRGRAVVTEQLALFLNAP